MEEGVKQAKADAIKCHPGNKISTTDKTQRTREAERHVEGGATMLYQADKTTLPSVDIVASLTTTRQSIARRRASQPSQDDNSQTMPPTLTTTIVAGCL